MNIHIRHIQHFIAVAQELHFRRAAQLVNVAQPALSRSVQTLENELGVKLLNRDNRNVSLTAAGEEFLNGCNNIMAAVQSAIEEAQRKEQSQFSGLRIGYTCTSLYGNMPKLLSEFEKSYPNVSMDLISDTDENLIAQLQRGTLDFCFHIGTQANHPSGNLTSAVVQHDAYCVVVYQSHPFANNDSISVNALNDQTIILSNSANGTKFSHHVQSMLAEVNIDANMVFVDQNIVGILGQVTLSKGITILTENCVCPDILHKLPLMDIQSKLPSQMTWRNDQASEPATQFQRFILNSVRPSHVPAPDTDTPPSPPTPSGV